MPDTPPSELAGAGRGFRDGAVLLPRAFGLLRRRRELWAPAVVPSLLTAVSLGLTAVLVYANAGALLGAIADALPRFEAGSWYSWLWIGPAKGLAFLARYVLFVGAAAVAVLLGLVAATLLSSPVLDVLSRRVERVLEGAAAGDDQPSSAAGVLREARAALSNEALRLGSFTAIWLAIVGLGLVAPFGPVVAPIALAALAIVFLPLEYSGFALDRRGVPFAGRRAWLASQRLKAVGFGTAGFAIGLLPGLNFVALPVLVVAGTILVLESPPR